MSEKSLQSKGVSRVPTPGRVALPYDCLETEANIEPCGGQTRNITSAVHSAHSKILKRKFWFRTRRAAQGLAFFVASIGIDLAKTRIGRQISAEICLSPSCIGLRCRGVDGRTFVALLMINPFIHREPGRKWEYDCRRFWVKKRFRLTCSWPWEV